MYIKWGIILAIILMILLPRYEVKCIDENIQEIELGYSYELDKDSVNNYPLEEVMAAIAYHECFNLSKLERWLIMEAFHNRLIDNFNNNGTTVKEQLLAPKQFTGLWKYNPEQFKYDTRDTLCTQNREMALSIIEGNRFHPEPLYYWAGPGDLRTAHGKWMKKVHIGLPKSIKHLFR